MFLTEVWRFFFYSDCYILSS